MTNFEKLFIEMINGKRDEAAKEGMQKGMQKGMEKGKQEGRKEGIINVIKEMLKNNMNDEIIIKITKVDSKQLQEIKEELKLSV